MYLGLGKRQCQHLDTVLDSTTASIRVVPGVTEVWLQSPDWFPWDVQVYKTKG
ncbi:hypothetical protein DPMN_120264 [Dreissena polymorpha]|uniref:Uncharacterized protein n=1 Tax=Dreissena polymorpha TaxID=45954 RepID=A0A9D4GKI2_DREPO|nr:hypothetical protein DPMN_120264 [Dreissena polymorpha]